jgi:hypothetical protein
MPKLTDAQLAKLIEAGATDEEILTLSQEDEGASSGVGGMLTAGAGALAAGGAALALRNPGIRAAAGRAWDTANNIRRQAMLTGLAIPKSLLGNLGAGVTTSIERGSLEPLKEMLRLPTNVKNAAAAFKEGATYQGGPVPRWALPGRILGASDEAAQAALVRAGLAPEEAAETMLQAPLGENRITNALQTRVGDYLVPFKRTPINQGIGALETMSNWSTPGQAAANAVALGAGAVTGAESEGVGPTIAGTAAFGRRGLPFAASSFIAKLLRGDSGREAAKVLQGASPVSDYSIQQGIAGPLSANPIPKPALYNLLFGK